jgi:hypothetical protein
VEEAIGNFSTNDRPPSCTALVLTMSPYLSTETSNSLTPWTMGERAALVT